VTLVAAAAGGGNPANPLGNAQSDDQQRSTCEKQQGLHHEFSPPTPRFFAIAVSLIGSRRSLLVGLPSRVGGCRELLRFICIRIVHDDLIVIVFAKLTSTSKTRRVAS
jgi:hypothetical protein